jgi:hypothetical protein
MYFKKYNKRSCVSLIGMGSKSVDILFLFERVSAKLCDRIDFELLNI